jgi:hypothetical protein
MPHHPATRTSAAMAQASAQGAQSAVRAAAGARLTWRDQMLEQLGKGSARLMFSTPLDVNPANAAEAGANCAIGQQGPVWFLSGAGGVSNFTIDCMHGHLHASAGLYE